MSGPEVEKVLDAAGAWAGPRGYRVTGHVLAPPGDLLTVTVERREGGRPLKVLIHERMAGAPGTIARMMDRFASMHRALEAPR